MKTLIAAAIRRSLMFTAVAALFIQPAQAYTVTLQQIGSNVVANGSGAFNLTGLTFFDHFFSESGIQAQRFGYISTGSQGRVQDVYNWINRGPRSFGSGHSFYADAVSGD